MSKTYRELTPILSGSVMHQHEVKQVDGDHYSKHIIQPWNIVDEYKLDFYLGNVIKYVLRDKGSQIVDLQKAVHYLEKKIKLLEGENNECN